MNEIVFVDIDDWVLIYIDGKLDYQGDRYNADFEYGFHLGKEHSNHKLIKYELSVDYEENEFPEDLEDIREYLI